MLHRHISEQLQLLPYVSTKTSNKGKVLIIIRTASCAVIYIHICMHTPTHDQDTDEPLSSYVTICWSLKCASEWSSEPYAGLLHCKHLNIHAKVETLWPSIGTFGI